jgi:hypothetical protein
MQACWLCKHCQTQDAKFYGTFISDNALTMAPDQVADQISRELDEKYPDTEGTDIDAVMQHIRYHTLDPTCRIASMLRSLTRLHDDVECQLHRMDENGHENLDPKMIETFLKIESQLLMIYRQVGVGRVKFSPS